MVEGSGKSGNWESRKLKFGFKMAMQYRRVFGRKGLGMARVKIQMIE